MRVFSFKGRLNRRPFWIEMLVLVVAANAIDRGLLRVLTELVRADSNYELFVLFFFAVQAIWLWIFFSLAARRAHDRDRSGAFALVLLIPVIGWVWFIAEAVQPGVKGTNRFGPDPLHHLQVNPVRVT